MASGRRGQSDVTLGGGHVAAIFLGIMVLCGIFFTLGYVMGKDRGAPPAVVAGNQKAPAVDSDGNLAASRGAPASTGWDFYPKKNSSTGDSAAAATPGLTPSAPTTSAPTQPTPSAPLPLTHAPIAMSTKPASLRIQPKPPALRGGSGGVSLQVAALANRTDALALAGFLKQKGYPAFAWGPAPDRLFRVQVGPYPNARVAESAKQQLEREGFKSILKR